MIYARERARKKADDIVCLGTALFAVSLPSRCRIFNIFYTAQKGGDNVDCGGGYED